MSVSTALHRAIGEVRDRYGWDSAEWNTIVETLIAGYALALDDETEAA